MKLLHREAVHGQFLFIITGITIIIHTIVPYKNVSLPRARELIVAFHFIIFIGF